MSKSTTSVSVVDKKGFNEKWKTTWKETGNGLEKPRTARAGVGAGAGSGGGAGAETRIKVELSQRRLQDKSRPTSSSKQLSKKQNLKKENINLLQVSDESKDFKSKANTGRKKTTGKSSTSSSSLRNRRNGCCQDAVFLRVSPHSADQVSPETIPDPQVKSASPNGNNKRLFASDRAKLSSKGRRETVCDETDSCAKERIATRVLKKRF